MSHLPPYICRYEPGPIAQSQALAFDPLLEFVKQGGLGAEGDWTGLCSSDSIFGSPQDDKVRPELSHPYISVTSPLTPLDDFRWRMLLGNSSSAWILGG